MGKRACWNETKALTPTTIAAAAVNMKKVDIRYPPDILVDIVGFS
jgi:hypothetical protein